MEISELVTSIRPHLNALVVCLSNSWGGLEQVAANDSEELVKLGLSVKVLVRAQSPIHEHLSKRPEITVLPIEFKPRNYLDFKMKAELESQLASGINLVHIHQTSLLGSIAPWLFQAKKTALLATRHIMNNHNKKGLIHRALYSRVDALMVMSRTLRKNVLETHSIREGKVRVVNLGLDFDLFDPDRVDPRKQRAEWGATEDTIVIGLVGRIDPAKGQATFIRAAAGLLKTVRAGEKFKFVIVGEETLGSTANYLEELKKMVTQFRLEEHVYFAGYKDNIPEIMRAFDIFVMPSRQEAFGLVAIEAMAMECPIVISSGGSADEIVASSEEGGACGLTMRPEDAFDLQVKLRHLLDSPMERVQMGQRARAHVKANYDRRIRLKRTLEIYDWVLKRRGIITRE